MSSLFEMPLNVSEWIADTQDMSEDVEGIYLRLCLCMWKKKGELPNDDLKLSRMARVTKAKWLKKYRPELEVEGLFYSKNDKFLHKKVQETFEKTSKKVEANRTNGSKGGRPKSLKNNNTAKPNGSTSVNPDDKPIENNQEQEIEIEQGVNSNKLPLTPDAGLIEKISILINPIAGQNLNTRLVQGDFSQFGVISEWLDWGASPDQIIGVVSDGAERKRTKGETISSLRYFENAITRILQGESPQAQSQSKKSGSKGHMTELLAGGK